MSPTKPVSHPVQPLSEVYLSKDIFTARFLVQTPSNTTSTTTRPAVQAVQSLLSRQTSPESCGVTHLVGLWTPSITDTTNPAV